MVLGPPLHELEERLFDLNGLVALVPRWIEDYRNEKLGGFEGRWGTADFERTILEAALVFAWEAFSGYLHEELLSRANFAFVDLPPYYQALADNEASEAGRTFDQLRKRYVWAGLPLTDIDGWDCVEQIRRHRNAIVHNEGKYTRAYVDGKCARFPDPNAFGLDDRVALIGSERIPLTRATVAEDIKRLKGFANLVSEDDFDGIDP